MQELYIGEANEEAKFGFPQEPEEKLSYADERISKDAIVINQTEEARQSVAVIQEQRPLSTRVHVDEEQLRKQFRQMVSKNDIFSVTMFEHITNGQARYQESSRLKRNKKLF